jgi:hypothetical protein
MSFGWGSPITGTVYLGGGFSYTPALSLREQCAEQAIKDWKASGGGWDKLRTLIVKAADEIVDYETEGDDDDED